MSHVHWMNRSLMIALLSASAAVTSAEPPTPLVDDGDKLLFIGNSYTANEGGVYSYLAKALKQSGDATISFDRKIYYGKPLQAMWTDEVRAAIASKQFDTVVITSGSLDVMKQFDAAIKAAGAKTVVFMTWSGQHPGNRATVSQYTQMTRESVSQMRQMEKETGAIIVPAAVAYHSLTLDPPGKPPRVDYLWRANNIHQNELGTMVNAWMFYAVLTGKSPVGLDFDMPPHVVGEVLSQDSELRLSPQLRKALQERVWQVTQHWRSGQSHLEQ